VFCAVDRFRHGLRRRRAVLAALEAERDAALRRRAAKEQDR